MNLEHRVAMLEQTNRRHERTNRRYRWCMIGLAALLLLTVGVGAVQVGEDGQLVLKRLVIEDDEGRERIVLGTWANGQASLTHFDRNGEMRIVAATFPGGQAGIAHFDANGKRRIDASTFPDGQAVIGHFDRNGKVRISAATVAGNASIDSVNTGSKPTIRANQQSKIIKAYETIYITDFPLGADKTICIQDEELRKRIIGSD